MSVSNFKELKEHAGHNIVCVVYAHEGIDANAAIECEDCYTVLLDYDNEETMGAGYYRPEELCETIHNLVAEEGEPYAVTMAKVNYVMEEIRHKEDFHDMVREIMKDYLPEEPFAPTKDDISPTTGGAI